MNHTPRSYLMQFIGDLFAAVPNQHDDNWDRFRTEHTDTPEWMQPKHGFDARRATENFAYVIENFELLNQIDQFFADDRSRELFRSLLLYRILGHRHVRLPSNRNTYRAHYDLALQSIVNYNTGPYVLNDPQLLQDMFHEFAVDFEGTRIQLECILTSAAFAYFHKQYYFDRLGRRIRPLPGDIAIDGGACFGETALAFASTIGDQGHVYSFDMTPRNIAMARRNFARNPGLGERITLIEAPLSAAAGQEIGFCDLGAASHVTSGDPNAARAITESIDHFVASRALPRVDFIKMDIEGAEFDALTGAQQTIREWRPRLAISVYHRHDDLVRIPALLVSLEPRYDLYLEHYTIDVGETILYAVPRSS